MKQAGQPVVATAPPGPWPAAGSDTQPGRWQPIGWRHGIGAYLLIALVYVVINYALTDNHPFPFVPDDFFVLGVGPQDMTWLWKRPVSTNLVMLIAPLGMVGAYVVLNAMAIGVAWVVLMLLGQVFQTRLHAVVLAMFAVMAFSHVSAFEHGKYLGLITNLISHSFGLLCLLLLWRGWRTGRLWPCLLALGFYGLSVLSKEDFVLPPWLLVALLALLDRQRGEGLGAERFEAGDAATRAASARLSTRRRWSLAIAFVAVGAGSLAWAAFDRNPYVSGLFSPATSAPSYAVDLGPMALLQATWTLLGGFAPLATGLAALACIVLWSIVPAWRLRVAWVVATIGALVLPYALIPGNMPPFRAYAWVPWLFAMVALCLQVVGSQLSTRLGLRLPARRVLGALGIAFVLLVAWGQQSARVSTARDYASGEDINRRMLALLAANRDVLSGQPIVGLHGLGGTSPWCGRGPLFVQRRLGYAQHWIVFAPAESSCYSNSAPGARRVNLVLPLEFAADTTLCARGDLPVLDFKPDGNGRLTTASELCRTRAVATPRR